MSNKNRPQYADQKGAIQLGLDGNIIEAEGTAVPADATAGYAPGATFYKRAGAAGASQYINEGSAASCAFKAVGANADKVVGGVAAGYKIARGGGAALDGSNPTPIATGLTTIVAAAVQLRGTAAPGDNTSVLTTDFTGSDGTLNVYAWKNTGGTDPTLVASTGTETFDWIAIGT